jgi:hypothetical protein
MKTILYLIIIIFMFPIFHIYGKAEKDGTTIFAPVLNTKIDNRNNLVYCVTFQLAWDELKKLAGGNIEMENAPELVSVLNNSKVKRNIIPKDAYIATAGLAEDGIIHEIDKKLKKQFGRRFSELTYYPRSGAEIIAFAYLFRKLPFKYKFNKFKDSSLPFYHGKSKTNVSYFGYTHQDSDGYDNGIYIIDYTNKDNFTLELLTKKANEKIILAKIPTPKNLNDAINLTAKYIFSKWENDEKIKKNGKAGSRFYGLVSQDTLIIPVINLDQKVNFDDLCKRSIKNTIFKANTLGQAFQKVNFKMNETGATVTSEAAIEDYFGGGSSYVEPKNLIFDKPFLLCLWKTGAKTPYLAIWINNPDILIKSSKAAFSNL